jgi:hypothetical protein
MLIAPCGFEVRAGSALPRRLKESFPNIAGHFGKLGEDAHVMQRPLVLTHEPERDLKGGFLGREPRRQLVCHCRIILQSDFCVYQRSGTQSIDGVSTAL